MTRIPATVTAFCAAIIMGILFFDVASRCSLPAAIITFLAVYATFEKRGQ